MTGQAKINGIRLNRNFTLLTQENIKGKASSDSLFYQSLEKDRINLTFMSLNTAGNRSYVSGIIDSKHTGKATRGGGEWTVQPDVCTVSIYPHRYSLIFLGFLMTVLGRQQVFFRHLVSSNAMLTFVADRQWCDHLIKTFSDSFNLPESHTPFEQEENEELTQFLKIKYPETRATYVENKIKTYGMTLTCDLSFSTYDFSFGELATAGQKILSDRVPEDRFFYTAARMGSPEKIHLFLLTEKIPDIPAEKIGTADFLSFQGPHFGDRHSIISRAMNCLAGKSIPVLLTGCTGAHISILLPRGKGREAKKALTEVFESP